MKYDLCCIGYITLDKVVTPQKTVHMPGGTSFYFAHAIKHLSTEGFQLVTALADSEMPVGDDLRTDGIEVKVLPSIHSICFENIYGEDTNERKQRVTAKADPFTIEGLQDVNARIFHLGSLLADDFSLDVIKYLAGKGLLSLDVQGYLREVQNEEVLAVKRIPKGMVATYGQVAYMAGDRKMARAVGNALHKNPDPENIPCFRVVNAKGELSGEFAFGGEGEQARRLQADGIEVKDGRVDLKKYGYTGE